MFLLSAEEEVAAVDTLTKVLEVEVEQDLLLQHQCHFHQDLWLLLWGQAVLLEQVEVLLEEMVEYLRLER
jgi:hypothetical protein